jgi:hypothetical protein
MKLDFASPPRPILEVNFHHFCTFSMPTDCQNPLEISRLFALRLPNRRSCRWRIPSGGGSISKSFRWRAIRWTVKRRVLQPDTLVRRCRICCRICSRVIRAFMSPETEGQSRVGTLAPGACRPVGRHAGLDLLFGYLCHQ